VIEFVKWVYRVLVMWSVVGIVWKAFDPKYRYNDHMKWEPKPAELVGIWFCIVAVWLAIVLK
jgi:hypothetical protein